MQKLRKRAPILYFVFLLLSVAFSFLFLQLGYRLVVYNEIICFLIGIAIIVMFTVLCVAKQEKPTKPIKIMAQFLPLLAALSIYLLDTLVDGENVTYQAMFWLLCFTSCYAVAFLSRNKGFFQIVITIFNSLLLCMLLWMSFLLMTFGQIGKDIIVKQVTSPGKSYKAILVAYDQGALGGSTWVGVEEHKTEMNIGLGRLVKKTGIYGGKWGEFDTMVLEWKDDHTLLINGTPHDIEKSF